MAVCSLWIFSTCPLYKICAALLSTCLARITCSWREGNVSVLHFRSLLSVVSLWTDLRMSLLYQRKIWTKVKMIHHQTKTVILSSVPAYPGDTSPGPWGKAGGYEGKQSRKNTLKMMKMKIPRTIQAENLVSISGLLNVWNILCWREEEWNSQFPVMTWTLVVLVPLVKCISYLLPVCKAVCCLFCCECSKGNLLSTRFLAFKISLYLNVCSPMSCPLWTVSALLYLSVWNVIAGNTKDGSKNILLYMYLKTFWITLKKLLLKETFSFTYCDLRIIALAQLSEKAAEVDSELMLTVENVNTFNS